MNAFDFVILRAPLHSLKYAFEQPHIDGNDEFTAAIQLAAPDLYKELQKAEPVPGKGTEKLSQSILKYWLRSCTRCTPYGIFAGTSLLKVGSENTRITLGNKDKHILNARLDMDYLNSIRELIEKNNDVRSQLKVFTNNSLYETAFDFRYAESYLRGETKMYKLSSIEKSEYVSFILKLTKDGKTLEELQNAFNKKYPEFSTEQTANFIDEMLHSQVLSSEIELNLTGEDPLEVLISKLNRFKNIDELTQKLKIINRLLTERNKVEYFENLSKEISNIFNTKKDVKNIIQIDLQLATASKIINKTCINEIVKQSSDLFALARINKVENLEEFKSKFSERFESQEVNLNYALDSDLGVGYGVRIDNQSPGNFWIDDLPNKVENSEYASSQDYITKYTFSKYQNFLENGESFIEIKDNELRALGNRGTPFRFASSLYIFGSLLKESNDLSGFQFYLNNISGPSAANMLGRFSLGDEGLTRSIRSVLEHEEQEFPDCIFAEIVHSPQSRIGNVLLRSNLRKYEIPYLGESGLNLEQQIRVDDLMVSVKRGEIILRSIKHNKRVFPRLSTAHNYSSNLNLPIYRFLCDLQRQNFATPNFWDWGSLRDLKYFPRVCYKNLILQKARWVIEKSEISSSKYNDPSEFADLREKRKLPLLVMMVEADNQLLLNLENDQAVLIFLSQIKKRGSVVLEEFLFDQKDCVVRDVDNLPYTNELIIPVTRDYDAKINSSINNISEKGIKRKFSPNSEWLYFKIYGGSSTLDKILRNAISPFIEDELARKSFEKFFFVRYTDKGGVHLRLRFYNSDIKNQNELQKRMMAILEPYLAVNSIYNILIDSYVREIERYHPVLIEQAESLFYNDSLAVIKLNNLLAEVEDSDNYRLLLAMRGTDIFLGDFNLDLKQRLTIVKELSAGYFNEFGASTDLKKSLNDKYRVAQKKIFSHMQETMDVENGIDEAILFFKMRSDRNKPVIETINKILETHEEISLREILKDYIHMFNNRFFKSHQRKNELIIYTFLEKYYMSQIAINNKTYQA